MALSIYNSNYPLVYGLSTFYHSRGCKCLNFEGVSLFSKGNTLLHVELHERSTRRDEFTQAVTSIDEHSCKK